MDLKSLGKYTLTRQFDHADQIEVYEALDSETNRSVLIKLLDPTGQPAANPKAIREFQDKATGLRHPYIASIYDIDRIDQRPFVVMEYLDETSLSTYLTQLRAYNQTIPLPEIARKLGLIADALNHAHEQGLAHRNLNPDNILLTDVDEPVLIDFGLVTLLIGDNAQFKPDGTGLGRPAYTSPEQAGGQPGDRLSDLYSLGVILYELVSGRLPFEADSPADMLAQQRQNLPPPPRTFNPDLPEAAQAVILQALAKEPGRRFTSARELSQAFAAALAETPAELDQSDDLMPQAIGRYQLEANLGQRGNLIVYRAHDVELDRPVAIKILSPQFVTGTELRTRFQHEVEVISALAHPCIVEVYDFGEVAGRPYVVMPYLAGGTLEIRLQDGPLDLQTLAPIIERVAAALDEAHTHHIIHAQLMPSNILFDGQDRAYLSDFTIPALAVASTDLGKQEGAAKAAKYLSPEQ
ncbi:MAG TPA: serine/threonine-protein kinase, partial [Anaerolineae bacterium]